MANKTSIQLFIMMFLEFFVWGTWYVTMGNYLSTHLKADGLQIGAAYGAQALAAMISPFLVGMLADRFFAAQRLLGTLHIVGAILFYFVTKAESFGMFYTLIFVYNLLYMPTLALANSITFNHISDTKSFAYYRVLGTIGWIASGWAVSFFQADTSAMMFILGGISSLILGLFCFTLPHTPPAKAGQSASFAEILGLDSLVLFKDRSYLIFFISSMLICIPLSFYYSFTGVFLTQAGMQGVASKMTMGQMSEIVFMLLVPLLYPRFGIKKMLLIGICAWIVRYFLFSQGNMDASAWMLYLGIILHGVCFDFFFVSGQIYTDYKAGDKIKSAAQGLITFATYGIGFFIGTNASGVVSKMYQNSDNTYDFSKFWLVPMGIAIFVLTFFLIFFREGKKEG